MKNGIILLFGLLWFVVSVVRAPDVPTGENIGIDESWVIGLAATLQQGQISGRDFFFTYGPMAQILAALPVPLTSSRSAIEAFPLILIAFWTSATILFLSVLWLIDAIDWKMAAAILIITAGLNLFSEPVSFRFLALMLFAVLLYRVLTQTNRQRRWSGAVITGISALLVQWITVELGVYAILLSTIVLPLCAALAMFSGRPLTKGMHSPLAYIEVLACIFAAFLLGNLLTGITFYLTSTNANGILDYQRTGMEMIRGYNLTMGTPWELSRPQTAGLMVISLYSMGGVILLVRRSVSEHYLLLVLGACALISVKSAFLRSDVGHVTSALGPMIFLFLVLAIYGRRTTRNAILWSTLLILLFSIWPWAGLSAAADFVRVARGNVDPVGKIAALRNRAITPREILPNGFVELETHPSSPILTFPYETYVPVVLNRKIAAPALQAYVANTPNLQHRYNFQLETWRSNIEVIYGIDGLGTGMIDGVQHVSRLPVIFEYLYSRFYLVDGLVPNSGFVFMKSRASPRRLTFDDIGFKSNEESGRIAELRLEQPHSCSLVQIGLTVDYPWSAFVWRPAGFEVGFFHGMAMVQRARLVALDNSGEFSTIVSLLKAENFPRILGEGVTAVQEWDRIVFFYTKNDFLDVPPNAARVNRIGCFRR